jgi:hypothetical protein
LVVKVSRLGRVSVGTPVIVAGVLSKATTDRNQPGLADPLVRPKRPEKKTPFSRGGVSKSMMPPENNANGPTFNSIALEYSKTPPAI